MHVRVRTHTRRQTYVPVAFVWRRNVKSQTTQTHIHRGREEHTNTERATTLLVVNSAQDMCESLRVETLLLLSCSDFEMLFSTVYTLHHSILHVFYTKIPFYKVVSGENSFSNAKCAVMLWLYFFFHARWLVNHFLILLTKNSAFHL